MNRHLRILGIRGIPANHGGFETFAEQLSLYLSARGWHVTVYCQESQQFSGVEESDWRGIRRVHIPVKGAGPAATIAFDWKSTLHACQESGLILTLGYNTAVFCALYRLFGLINVINMDGIEWRRKKWGRLAKAWFYLNERAGVWFGNHLIADHPEIKRHLATRIREEKISMIAYGAERIDSADLNILDRYCVRPNRYGIVVARAEPENSVLEVVRAWSRKIRGMPLLVLGQYTNERPYHAKIFESASHEVIFAGGVYEKDTIAALRFFSRIYIHGHQVGGTNPSLVEALGAGNAVLAHDNPFNRWVAGEAGLYFQDEESCAQLIDQLTHEDIRLRVLQKASRHRHADLFTWGKTLGEYETLLRSFAADYEVNEAVEDFHGVTDAEGRLRRGQ
jgi:glycosyltransferase involved in cell wall biosynthesis